MKILPLIIPFMKTNRIILLAVFSLSLGGFFSCVPVESCKNCEAVTYEAGTSNIIDRQDAIEYCGDDLFAKENTAPVVIGSDSTIWECN